MNVKPGWALCGLQPLAHESHQLALRTADLTFQPNDKPITTTAMSAAVFANVNVFWTIFPTSSPRVLLHVSKAIKPIATNCSVYKLIA